MRDPRPLIGPKSPSLASDWLTSWQRLGCAEQRPGATNPCFNVYKNWPIDLISSDSAVCESFESLISIMLRQIADDQFYFHSDYSLHIYILFISHYPIK